MFFRILLSSSAVVAVLSSCAPPAALPTTLPSTLPDSVSHEAQASYPDAPGWSTATEGAGQGGGFLLGKDTSVFHGGHASCTIRSTAAKPGGWMPLTQEILANAYRGKRIRLRAFVKTKDASAATLWMRVDSIDRTEEFDNMEARPIRGTNDWKAYSVVLDVPQDAVTLCFGAMLTGQGQMWVDDFSLQPVNPSKMPATGGWLGPDYQRDPVKPSNMDFAAAPKTASKFDVPGWNTSTGAWNASVHRDAAVLRGGKPTVAIKGENSASGDSGAGVVQEIQAKPYLGKRVRFSAFIKTAGDVAGGTMLAVPGGGQWAFEPVPKRVEINRRWVSDTREWKLVSATLDIPKWAKCIQYGAMLRGPGKLWMGQSSLKIVNPKTTPVTQCEAVPMLYSVAELRSIPSTPENLNFEK